MPKNLLPFFGVLMMSLVLAGCGVQAKQYIQVRDRIDQKPEGNAGYLAGTPKPEDRSDIRKTRKIYVLEFTKEDNESAEEEIAPLPPAPVSSSPSRYRQPERAPRPQPVLAVEPAPAPKTGFETYVIQKDDTMQKIAKKYYDSYSKWTKIYEANKDVIKDPNRIKPGTTIKIPLE